MKLSYDTFSGIAPRIAPRLLPASFAQTAINTKLWSGELRPFFEDQIIRNVNANTKTIYKYKFYNTTDVWLTWTTDVNIVKGPVYNDDNNRIIISGIGNSLRVTDSTYLSPDTTTINTSNSIELAVPRANRPTNMTVGGTGTENLESRTYAIALVREWSDGKLDVGQLSEPAITPAGEVVVDVYSGQTVSITINIPASVYTNNGVRNVYIYRSAVGSSGDTAYRFVDELDVPSTGLTTTYVDSKLTTELQEVAVSTTWTAPIDGLQGIISLNNGVLAAFNGNDLYFSYPYQSQAWPTAYRVAFDYPIVGLGTFGNNVVVCTTVSPALVLVADPASATMQPIQENLPCLSARSIVSTSLGVIYATRNGLCLISSTSPSIITDPFITRDEWLSWNPDSMVSGFYDGSYFGSFRNPDITPSFIYDLEEPEKGFVTLSNSYNAILTNAEEEYLYGVRKISNRQTSIVAFDNDRSLTRQYIWRSKIDVSPEGIFTFSAAQVIAQYGLFPVGVIFTPEYVAEDTSINSTVINYTYLAGPIDLASIYASLRAQYSVGFKYIIDGVVRYETTLTNNEPFRLPSGFRGSEIEIEVTSNTPIHYIRLASSIAELA